MPSHIDDYIRLTAQVRKLDLSEILGYGDFMKSTFRKLSKEEHFNWAKCQTYIAAANLLSACAELKIDACPMEGFEPEKYNEILDLNNKGLNASLVTAVGYRSLEDKTQYQVKVRKPEYSLFKTIY